MNETVIISKRMAAYLIAYGCTLNNVKRDLKIEGKKVFFFKNNKILVEAMSLYPKFKDSFVQLEQNFTIAKETQHVEQNGNIPGESTIGE